MKTFKKSKVIMLPTNEKAVKGDIIGNNKGFTIADELYSLTELSFIQAKVYKLYFLSDEKIKKGDWMFHKLDEKPAQWNGEVVNPSVYGYKKIIATTDKSLGADYNGAFGGLGKLPQPSQSFIKKFVEEYNKGNVITEVKVEYENEDMDFHPAKPNGINWINKLKINPDNTITIQKLKQQFSREEVIHLLRLAFDAGKHEAVKMNEWIDETLNY